ncbi:hypothetical protein BJ165DRAFT_1431933 [Panaeolus papilionaceus]|nr:hypothetical protein BJ165DRAFT_1431933 [Panaeolus papilionaceus]
MFPSQLHHPDHYTFSILHQEIEQRQPPILHAPIPLSVQIPLLQEPLQSLHHGICNDTPRPPSPPMRRSIHGFDLLPTDRESRYYTVAAAQQPGAGRLTFPTPSELLTDMANSPDSLSSNSSGESWGSSSSANKARRRVVAESIGFDSTDPDTITSHDKKRHYLECLESYISFLNSYFESIGAPIPPLTRFEHQKELDNRSIRTLLVYMTHRAEELCLSKEREEKRWLQLKESVARREAQFACD